MRARSSSGRLPIGASTAMLDDVDRMLQLPSRTGRLALAVWLVSGLSSLAIGAAVLHPGVAGSALLIVSFGLALGALVAGRRLVSSIAASLVAVGVRTREHRSLLRRLPEPSHPDTKGTPRRPRAPGAIVSAA